jgi:hypothetical protein
VNNISSKNRGKSKLDHSNRGREKIPVSTREKIPVSTQSDQRIERNCERYTIISMEANDTQLSMEANDTLLWKRKKFRTTHCYIILRLSSIWTGQWLALTWDEPWQNDFFGTDGRVNCGTSGRVNCLDLRIEKCVCLFKTIHLCFILKSYFIYSKFKNQILCTPELWSMRSIVWSLNVSGV